MECIYCGWQSQLFANYDEKHNFSLKINDDKPIRVLDDVGPITALSCGWEFAYGVIGVTLAYSW